MVGRWWRMQHNVPPSSSFRPFIPFAAILALVSLLLVPGLITKPPRPPGADAATGPSTLPELTRVPDERAAIRPLPTVAPAAARTVDKEEEGGGEFSAATSALPMFDEAKEDTIESLVEQPLLRLYRQISAGE